MNVLLSSGGMDSFLLAQRLGPDARHVFVDVGQRYLAKELRAARAIAENTGAELVLAKGAQIGMHQHVSGIIPFRNAELILCAAQHGTDIYLGVLADEINSDKSVEFMMFMEQVLNISYRKQYWTEGKTFRIRTPLRTHTKSQAVAEYLDSDRYNLEHLLATVSCYSGTNEVHCGACASCFKRWVALVNNDIPRGSLRDIGWHFDSDPAMWKNPADWKRILPGYAPARAAEVESALRKAGVPL